MTPSPAFARLLPRVMPARTLIGAADPWRWTVAAGWIALTAAVLVYIALFGRNSPWTDEWTQLAPLVGEQPVLPWLWEPHNEHRFPLPRLAWYALHQIASNDFRAGMVASALAMSAASWALLNATRTVRGRSHPADLLLAALLLHLWHCENWLLGYQVAFTLPAAFTAGVLALAVRPVPTPSRIAAAGWLTVLVALCGGAGVVLTGPLAAWVLFAGMLTARQSTRPVRAALAAIFPLTVLAVYVWLYLSAMQPNPDPTLAAAGWWDRAVVAVAVVASGMGGGGKLLWPATGVLAIGTLGAAGFALIRAMWSNPTERVRAAGTGAVMAAGAAVAAAIGVGRAGIGLDAGFAYRYAVFGALPLAACYFALLLYGPRRFAPAGRTVSIIAAIGVVGFSLAPAWSYGGVVRYRQVVLLTAIKSGATPEAIAAHCVTHVLSPSDTPELRAALTDGLRLLERHRIGWYRGLK